MDLAEKNPVSAAVRAEDKRFFVRLSSGVNFLKIFKSVTLPSSNIVLFITGGDSKAVTIMCENQRCVQGSCAGIPIFYLIT